MAVESKPLFHPEVMRQQVRSFNPPEPVAAWQPKLQHWASLIASGRADEFKETELLPGFLTDIFCGLLGYTGPAEAPDSYTLSRERHVEVDGKFADAVLGRFGVVLPTGSEGRARTPLRAANVEQQQERGNAPIRPRRATECAPYLQEAKDEFIAVLEGKGTRDPLDRPFAGRRMSAVDQAYRYAINLPCDWIIVTSMRETRLYYKGAHQQTYERFDTVRLAADEALLKRFVFLLGAERVVPEQPLRLRGDRWQYRLIAQFMEEVPIPDAPEPEREAIANLARTCSSLGQERYQGQVNFHRRLVQAFSGGHPGPLNQKAEAWWDLSLNQLGDALKQSFKLPTNPMKNPRLADEWEPYLQEKRNENARLTRALANAEVELNDRVYRLFNLTAEEVKLLQQEVEH